VTYDLACDPGAIDSDPSAKACFIDTLSELVGNAVRHGYASHVSVLVQQESPKAMRGEVSDDGRCPSAETGAGLGSQIMDDCCLEWERSSSPGGTTVWFVMPCEGWSGVRGGSMIAISG
jgi:two-component sensor histidine kinase